MRVLLAALPYASSVPADDDSTLLSVRGQTTLNQESGSQSFSAANFMHVIQGQNVTQMASLMQNFVESQLNGDGVTELDSEVAEALKTIKALLLGEIQTALTKEHTGDQESVDALHKCWEKCEDAKQEDQDDVGKFWDLMQSAKSAHETCREDLHGKYIDKVTKCNALDVWVKDLECPECNKEECVVIHQPDSKTIGTMLQGHITWATNNHAEWTKLNEACSKAAEAYTDADFECDDVQTEFETNTCGHRQAVWSSCNVNQMECCATCSEDFDKEVNRVECAEKDRKIDWSATKKIECYIDVLMASPTKDELKNGKTFVDDRGNTVTRSGCKEGGKSCINQYREQMYKDCEEVCVEVDFEPGTAEYRETDGINTTHRTRSSDGGSVTGDRCTTHLDINFPQMPHCEKCPHPLPGPCEFPFISTYYEDFDNTGGIDALSGAKPCTPDKHTHQWAYSRAECKPCTDLIGRSKNADDSCFWGDTLMVADNGHANGYLNIMDVEVNGAAPAKAELSSKWSNSWKAENCLDGDPETGCHSGRNQATNWWATFKLDEPTCINSIKIVNRPTSHCEGLPKSKRCTGRFVGADVSVLNQGTMLWTDRVESDQPSWEWTLAGRDIKDDCEGWSRSERKMIDGTCFLGAYGKKDASTKKFTGLSGGGCTYTMKGVMDTWGSVDSELYTVSINGKTTTFSTRPAVTCNNGWQSHPYGFGKKLGSGGSGKHNWQDCYKPFEIEFIAPATGTVDVSMSLAVDSGINDEAWGFHDIEFELKRCGAIQDDGSGWSVGKNHFVDGTLFMGSFTKGDRPKKSFTDLEVDCTYKVKAVIDTWASTDREKFTFNFNGEKTVWGHNEMRHATGCDNGWNKHPYGLGAKVGSSGSGKHGWQDCWKDFETEFRVPQDGRVDIDFHIAVDQHSGDEAWGFHDLVIEKMHCDPVPPTEDNCGGLDGGGWKLVRHVPSGHQWHQATDQLRGTDQYGVKDGPTSGEQWSTRFDGETYNQFLFATGDCEHWLIATKDTVIGSNGHEYYANKHRTILSSSKEKNKHSQARWYRRNGAREDPWISTIDHGPAIGQGEIVYGENRYGGGHAGNILPAHKGANVYIRQK